MILFQMFILEGSKITGVVFTKPHMLLCNFLGLARVHSRFKARHRSAATLVDRQTSQALSLSIRIKAARLTHSTFCRLPIFQTPNRDYHTIFVNLVVKMASVIDKVKSVAGSGPLKPGSKTPTNVGSLKENSPMEANVDLGAILLKGKSEFASTISIEEREAIWLTLYRYPRWSTRRIQ